MRVEILSGVREALRTTIIILIPVLLVQIESGELDTKIILITILGGLLRGIEKYLHETERTTGLEFKMIK